MKVIYFNIDFICESNETINHIKSNFKEVEMMKRDERIKSLDFQSYFNPFAAN
jgi:hypothetical protein